VIAFFYSAGIALEGIALVGVGVAMVLTFRAAGVRAPLLYVAPGVIVWVGLLVGGIHPTIGGVISRSANRSGSQPSRSVRANCASRLVPKTSPSAACCWSGWSAGSASQCRCSSHSSRFLRALLDTAKLAILVGSGAAIVVGLGYCLLVQRNGVG
jgi:Na+/H+ antiporter NhaA